MAENDTANAPMPCAASVDEMGEALGELLTLETTAASGHERLVGAAAVISQVACPDFLRVLSRWHRAAELAERVHTLLAVPRRGPFLNRIDVEERQLLAKVVASWLDLLQREERLRHLQTMLRGLHSDLLASGLSREGPSSPAGHSEAGSTLGPSPTKPPASAGLAVAETVLVAPEVPECVVAPEVPECVVAPEVPECVGVRSAPEDPVR